MDINKKIAEELSVKLWQVEAAVGLIDEGNTIPFISRYRKEVTGSLNDEQLRTLDERLKYLRNLEEKKEQVLATIEEQGKLTEELKAQILADLVKNIWPKVESGDVKPTIYKVLPIQEAEAAHDILYKGQNVGKVVLTV